MKQRLNLLRAGASALALLAGAPVAASTFDFAFTGAIETGTITEAGIYEVSLGGALGGDSLQNIASQGYFGGYGARVSGTAFLSAGTAFSVLVGGYGQDGLYSGGGGGMSWLDFGSDGSIEAVAGGGGGAGTYGDGQDGRAGPDGGDGDGGSYYGYGGTGGFGGQAGTGDSGAGGAGVRGPGFDSYAGYATGGASAPTWAGGPGDDGGGDGGFGGGGGGNYYGGGGGGGYSGGGGGDGFYYGYGGGGGGGSYLASAFGDRSLVTGGATSGAYVSLHLVQPIPTPGAFALMGTSALAFAAVARSRRRRS